MLGGLTDWYEGLEQHAAWTTRVGTALLLFVAAMIANRVLRRVLRRAYWRRAAASVDRTRAEDLRRTKRQQTVLTVLESLSRYLIYGAAALMALSVLTAGAASAVFGGALVIVLAGFVFQSFLRDVVAGGLLLFEGRYGVGDFVAFHTINVAGVVEEFGLRTTTLRTLAGSHVTILNGAITSFTRHPHGYSDYRVRFTARGTDVEPRVHRIIERLAPPARPFLLGPHLERLAPATAAADEQAFDVELRVVVAPSHADLVEEGVRRSVEAVFQADLEGAVDVYAVDDRAFEGYRSSILLDGA